MITQDQFQTAGLISPEAIVPVRAALTDANLSEKSHKSVISAYSLSNNGLFREKHLSDFLDQSELTLNVNRQHYEP